MRSIPTGIRRAPVLPLVLLLAVHAAPTGARAQAPPAADSLAGEGPAEHVVLVSIDGFRPDFYLDPSWPAPLLQRAVREGAHARGVRGVFPSVTYPSHTTVLTGARPARHGIYYNEPFDPDGQTGRWYWETRAIRVPTLWHVVEEAGGTTASLAWPVSVGAPVDMNVPEIWSLDDGVGRLEAIAEHERPRGLLDELARRATGELVAYGPDGPSDEAWTFRWQDERMTRAAEYLIERHRPHLLTLHLIDTDHQQHEHGRDGSSVVEAVAHADRALARLQEAVERVGILDRTAFVVVGDHGFIDTSTRLAPNVWLAGAGLMEPTSDRGEWRATFHVSGGAAFLHLRDPDDGGAVDAVRAVLDDLPSGVRRLFRVVEVEELRRLGADPRVRLALSAEQGVRFTGRSFGDAVAPASGGTHGYLPDFHPDIHTGFVAWGAGIRPGAVAPIMGLEDVAPFVARLLGVPLEPADGVVVPGLLARPEG